MTPTPSAREPERNWLIYDNRSECYWGPNRGGYFKSLASAGLYTEREAREAEDFAKRYGRKEIAVPLEQFRSQVVQLADALNILKAAHRAGYQAALREVRKELAGYDVHEIRRGTPDPVVDGWADGHAYGYRQLRDDFCAWLDTALGAEGEQEK
jgi:hypothetical protein